MQTLPQNIHAIGRRWFQRGPGNTYHSCSVLADGRLIERVRFAYGYGDQYEQTAADILVRAGILTIERYETSGMRETLRAACQRLGIAYTCEVADVPRKRDL